MPSTMWCMVMVINSSWRNSLPQEVDRERETDQVGFPLLHPVVNCEAVFCLSSVVFGVQSLGEHPHGGETYFCRTQQVNCESHPSIGGCETGRGTGFKSVSTSVSVFLTVSALQMFPPSHMPLSLASPMSSRKLHIRHEGKEALLLILDNPLMKWYCGPYKRATFLTWGSKKTSQRKWQMGQYLKQDTQ